MTKKTTFSQVTKRKRIKVDQAHPGHLITSTTYYRQWAVIRHLCKRDGYVIYVYPNCVEIITGSERMNQAYLDLTSLGFSFQLKAF